MRTDLHYWASLWKHCDCDGNGIAWHKRLVASYAGPGRCYHSLQHLDECLSAFDSARAVALLPNAAAIEMALWFHDAVYDPRAADNEERSAELARAALIEANAKPALISDVTRLILATKTHQADGQADAEWLLDIDLSILAQPPQRFDEYEAQIRKEYAWVPADVYAEKRAEIMAGFLNRERIYKTDFFHARFDAQARVNLRSLIQRLRTA
jgi:predicted metal-dependent HD superfamily phosphohydrolase